VKGIILAGGSGTRLHPITRAVCKQLLPVYDKPMIYYPLSVLMLAGIRDILVITTPGDQATFQHILGDGHEFGINLSYAVQDKPRGLGDNIFYGHGFDKTVQDAARSVEGCTLFGYPVKDPERYGVAEADADGRILSIEEKPAAPKSNLAVTGLYFYDNDVIAMARDLKPSDRGELEITDINNIYRMQGRANLVNLGRGTAWLDTGTHDSLLEAGQYVQVLEHRQGVRIACLEEIAFHMGYIDAEQTYALGAALAKSGYGQYVMQVALRGGAVGV